LGVGTSSPNTSAKVDVDATNKGVLLPRVTLTGSTDATTIVTPATSLLVYNTATVSDVVPGYYYNSGTSGSPVWIRLNTTVKHTIGESFGGGIVFYVTPDGLHGLIAETQDCGAGPWSYAGNDISNPQLHSSAGKLFFDWRTPTIVELGLLYVNKLAAGISMTNVFWSSTEVFNNNTTAFTLNFYNGSYDLVSKTLYMYYRAIRSF
jgi:hypothetical protein